MWLPFVAVAAGVGLGVVVHERVAGEQARAGEALPAGAALARPQPAVPPHVRRQQPRLAVPGDERGTLLDPTFEHTMPPIGQVVPGL